MTMLENDHDQALQSSTFDFAKNEAACSNQLRVLFVDDDDDYREAATAELEYFGFEVSGYGSCERLLDHLDHENWRGDVIILDWCLPAGPAVDILPELHRRGIDLPIVFLTELSSAANEIAALDHGATDFIDKTRGIPILAKRLKLITQHCKGPAGQAAQDSIECGKLHLRADIGRAYWDGIDVDLTLTEFRIVYLLASRTGDYVTYRTVYDCVHHAGFVAGNGDDGFRTNVRSAIRRIRNKFRALDHKFSAIENYPSFGYRWHGAAAKLYGDLSAELAGTEAPATA